MCRSRRELSNEYLLAKIGVDTAENEPCKVWGNFQVIFHSPPYSSCGNFLSSLQPSVCYTIVYSIVRCHLRMVEKNQRQEGAGDHLLKNTGQGAPESIPPSQWGKRQHENEVTKREERKTQIVYHSPGYKRGRFEPGYADAACREQKTFLGVSFPQTF